MEMTDSHGGARRTTRRRFFVRQPRCGEASLYRQCARSRAIAALALSLACIGVAHADLDDPTLYFLDPNSPFNALEIASAQANQAVYNALTAKCAPAAAGRPSPCTAAELGTLAIATELVDTANQLLGGGPTGQSLGLDITGLRLALRWTAATEVAAIGAINTKFAGNQLAGVANRLAALRGPAGGRFAAAPLGAPIDAAVALASAQPPLGGGASADIGIAAPFSMYVDDSYDFGTKSPTVLEDAFAYDGREFTLGGDYRFSRYFVAGAVFGDSEKRVDFNSDLSTVDGNIHANGYSGILYGMFENDAFYLDLSAGLQRLSYDINRRISYPSLNPAISNVDSTALSNTASTSLLSSMNLGYSAHFGAFGIEPHFGADYKNIRVDGFQEQAHLTSAPTVLTPYGVVITPQKIDSFELSAGLKMQVVWTSRIGVVVPYFNGVYHNQLSDKARHYTATYAAIAADGFGPEASFLLATDPSPGHYFTVAGGISAVLPHGIQGYVQYTRMLEYTNYTDQMVSGGIRIEF